MRAWLYSSDSVAAAVTAVLAPLDFTVERAARCPTSRPPPGVTLAVFEWALYGPGAADQCRALARSLRAPLLVILADDCPATAAAALSAGAGDVLRLPGDEARLTARAMAAQAPPVSSDWSELFARAPIPCWVFDIETLALLAVNEAMVANYGWSRAELLGMTLRDLRPPSELARFDAVLSGNAAAATPTWIHQRKDGSWLDVEVVSAPITFAGREARIVICHDVSKHVRAAEAHARERFDYRQFIERTPDGVLTYAPDGRIVDANPAFLEMLGQKTVADVYGHPVTDFVHPDDHEEVRARMRTTLVSRQSTVPGPIRFVGPSGQVRWTETRGIRVGYDGGSAVTVIARDLTERRSAGEALRLSEERFSKIFRASPACISVTRVSDDVFIDVNDRFLAAIGYARHEIIGHTGVEVGLWQSRDQRGQLAEVIRAGGKVRDASVTLVTKAGAPIEFLMSLESFSVGGEECVMALGNDVTERQQLEEQLRQTQKMEAIGRLAGGVAHDFNNLLTAIRGYCELLLQELKPDTPAHKAALHIHRSALRAASLTGQLLALTRRQPHQPRVLVLNDVVISMGALLSRIIGEDISLELKLASDLGRVRVDPTQVEQVLLNLAVNARDAMTRGGRLVIETSNVSDGAGHHVKLSVCDTGRGMTDETRKRIFEPFFTTKDVGTGLGLSIVYGVVMQNGGSISVESAPERGATFHILLPRVDAPATRLVEPLPSATPRIGGRETILLVEDDEDVREFVSHVLRNAAYDVLPAADGRAAVQLARTHPGRIDLLLSDVIMPHLNGIELVSRLAPLRPEMRVLHMSGYPGDNIARHGEIPPGTAFLQKPFSSADLTDAVRQALESSPAPGRH